MLKKPPQVPKIPVDGGYTGQNFADEIRGHFKGGG